MKIKIIRNDFCWKDLYTNRPGTYLWLVNDNKYNKWKQELDPEMKYTDSKDMQTLVTIKCGDCPGFKTNSFVSDYIAHWKEYANYLHWYDWLGSYWPDYEQKRAALWTSWSYINEEIGGQYSGQYEFIYPLLRVLNDKVGAPEPTDYTIRGFCIENEPNTQIIEQNYLQILIPSGLKYECYYKWVWVWAGWHSGLKYLPQYSWAATFTTYTTADMVLDELNFVKNKCLTDPLLPNLRTCKTVVNLHGIGDCWKSKNWVKVRDSNSLDVLGLDVYRTHGEYWSSICTDIQNTQDYATQKGKDWWIVETEGASAPCYIYGHGNEDPCADEIVALGQYSYNHGAKVLGFYRLWGNYNTDTDYAKGYNIYINPGQNPTATKDVNNEYYYQHIRDNFNTP